MDDLYIELNNGYLNSRYIQKIYVYVAKGGYGGYNVMIEDAKGEKYVYLSSKTKPPALEAMDALIMAIAPRSFSIDIQNEEKNDERS